MSNLDFIATTDHDAVRTAFQFLMEHREGRISTSSLAIYNCLSREHGRVIATFAHSPISGLTVCGMSAVIVSGEGTDADPVQPHHSIILVHPAYRGLGVGKELMKLKIKCFSGSFPGVHLETTTNVINVSCQIILLSCGMRPIRIFQSPEHPDRRLITYSI